MATTEEELKRLERELRQTSMMTSAVRSAQSRFISTMTRHSDAVSKSIITTLQEIKGSSDNTKLSKKRLEVLQKQLEKTQQDLTATTARITALRSITTRTTEQEKELQKLIAAEERQKTAVDNLTDEIKAKTEELKYVKFQTLATTVTALAGGMMSLAASVRETQQRFGIAADQAAGLQFKNLKQSMSSYVDALTGRGPAATMEQIAATQEAFQQQFGGVLDPEAAKRLTQEAIKMGVTAEQMADARRVFMTQTGGDLNKATKQTDKFIGEFKKKGLTAKDAMQAIQQNSELLARNGTRFAGSFARAAADAVKIGVNLSKISQVGDNIISDFEGFLESQAELGAMGFGFDSSRLAEIAETGSDADLFNELRSQLSATGKDINKLRRSERLALESAFGINISEMQKLATPPGKEGSGEKTMEQYQENTNSLLTTAVGVLEGVGKGLAVIGSVISGIIAASTAITAANTTAIVTAMGATIPAILTGILSALTPLVGIGVAIASIWGAIQLWKLGSKNVEEGKEKIRTGQEGGTGQLIKGRAQQGAGIGAGSGTVLGGLVAGALLTGTGVGAGVGIPLMLAAMGAGAAAGGATGGVIGAGTGAVQAGNLKRTKGDDVVSKPGYGKRALLTPSGIIALNNKDNIIAYADDFDGTKTLPKGSIVNQASDSARSVAKDTIQGIIIKKVNEKAVEKSVSATARMMANSIPFVGDFVGGAMVLRDEYKRLGDFKKAAGIAAGYMAASATAGASAAALTGGVTVAGIATAPAAPFTAAAADMLASPIAGEAYLAGVHKTIKPADDYISYADDLMGGRKLPLGTISKMFSVYNQGGSGGVKSNLMSNGLGLANKNIPGFSKYMPQATDLYGTYKQSGTAGLKATALEKGLGFLGNRIPQLSGSIDAYKQGGVTGAKSSLLNTGLGLLGKKFPSLSGSIDVFKEGGFGGLKSNLMNKGTELLAKKVPGLSGVMSAFSAYKKGGVAGALGSLAQGGIGKGIGAAIGTAIPIPFVGTALGSLVGSKLGKLAGGLFGKKKQQTTTISPEMMQAGAVPDLSTFLGSQARREETKQAPQQQVTVDTSGIENKLNNFINALQNIQINMDGTKVGKVLVNSSDAAMSAAGFRVQSR